MYSIFKNDFFDVSPSPRWAFTVEFFLSEDLQVSDDSVSEISGDPPKMISDLVEKLREKSRYNKNGWEDKLQKSITKLPVPFPTPAGHIPIYFSGYFKHYTGRYDQSGSIELTFNDNIDRDVRFILEELMHLDGLGYGNVTTAESTRPTLPPCFMFDMLVRVYDIEKLMLYSGTEAIDEVADRFTVQSFMLECCYVNKIGAENNSSESTEQTRTVDAEITYQIMRPLSGV